MDMRKLSYVLVVLLIVADPSGLNSTCFTYVLRDSESNLILISLVYNNTSVGEDPRGLPD